MSPRKSVPFWRSPETGIPEVALTFSCSGEMSRSEMTYPRYMLLEVSWWNLNGFKLTRGLVQTIENTLKIAGVILKRTISEHCYVIDAGMGKLLKVLQHIVHQCDKGKWCNSEAKSNEIKLKRDQTATKI